MSEKLEYVNAGPVYPRRLRRTGEAVPFCEGSPVIALLHQIDLSVGGTTVAADELLTRVVLRRH